MRPTPPFLVLIAPERGDARVARRVRGFQAHGWVVTVFAFHRSRSESATAHSFPHIDLGETRDRAYVHRFFSLLRALRLLCTHRATLRSASALYAINTDNAVLALAARAIARHPLPLFLEISDIQPPFTRPGLAGRLLRWTERRILHHITCLVTSSPAFVREYFDRRQHYAGRVLILENKVYPSAGLDPSPPHPPPPGPPWRIGWFGALRCPVSWNAIRTLAQRHPKLLHFTLRGYPTAFEAETFRLQAAESPAIDFGGPYTYPEALPSLHQPLHFTWGFDFSDPAANSRWLLPNRLYESSLFHVPMLAATNTETGHRLAATGTGPTLPVTPASLVDTLSAFFTTLTPASWHAWHAALTTQPPDAFRGETDVHTLHTHLLAACHQATTTPEHRRVPESDNGLGRNK